MAKWKIHNMVSPGKSSTHDGLSWFTVSLFIHIYVIPLPRGMSISRCFFQKERLDCDSFQVFLPHQDALPVLPIAALNGVSVLTNNKALRETTANGMRWMF
jgi:hypothetical protein